MQSLYKYFSSSPKKHLELAKLGEITETKGFPKQCQDMLDFYVKPI
jgi:hypothetical protein